jgi:PAS domain S-box-containing protein
VPPEDERLLEAAVEHVRTPILITEASSLDAPGPQITYANPAFTEVTGYSLEEIRGRSPRFLQGPDTSREPLDRIRAALEADVPVRETVLNYRKDGTPYWNDVYIAPVRAADGTVTHYVSVQDDVTDRRQAARLRDEQNRLLERIATGAPLSDVLSELLSFIEAERPGLFGSVLLLDAEGQALYHGGAPSLPEAFLEAVDGLPVGPHVGACGTAAYHDAPVVVEDIATDEKCSGYRDLALEHGLRACWSTPIHGEDGEVLGTFALYYDEPRAPTAAERRLVEEASHIAGVAIEHDQQKRALQLQEEQFQRLVENAQPIVFLLDADGTFLLSEGEDLGAVGLEPGEAVGTSVYDRYADHPALLAHIDRALDGETVDDTIEMGDVVFDIWYAPYYDRSGDVAGCIGMAVDITERRAAEAALRANRDLLRRTQEIAHVGGWAYDPQTDTMVGTEETYRLYEIPPDAAFSLQESLTFYPPEVESSLKAAAARCLTDGEPFAVEGPMTGREGTRRWVRIRGEARHADDGTVERMVGTVQDLTERHEMEERLRASEQRFRGLFEEAALGIALLGPDGTIVEANPELASMLDAPPQSLHGHSFSALAHPEDQGEDAELFAALVQGERGRYEVEKRFVRHDDTVFWGRVTVSSHEGPGTPEAIGMVEDISSQRAYERQLREAKQEAEEASRLKSALLANMSHEIRTPLTSMIGFTGVLQDNLSGTDARYARLAHQGGKRLMDTLDSVLQLSKLEAGVTSPDTERVDLVEQGRETCALFQSQAEEAGVTLRFDAAVDALHGRWAPTAVQRVLSNLLNNALKFTPSGGTVTVRVRRDGDAAVLAVEDTGVGIAEDARSRIFKAFTQESEGLQREHEGSGLGLAIVRRLVDLIGGEIDLESTKGEGTCFTVRLPLGA